MKGYIIIQVKTFKQLFWDCNYYTWYIQEALVEGWNYHDDLPNGWNRFTLSKRSTIVNCTAPSFASWCVQIVHKNHDTTVRKEYLLLLFRLINVIDTIWDIPVLFVFYLVTRSKSEPIASFVCFYTKLNSTTFLIL